MSFRMRELSFMLPLGPGGLDNCLVFQTHLLTQSSLQDFVCSTVCFAYFTFVCCVPHTKEPSLKPFISKEKWISTFLDSI